MMMMVTPAHLAELASAFLHFLLWTFLKEKVGIKDQMGCGFSQHVWGEVSH